MSTEEKKNFQTFQDSNNVYKPLDEREASNFIKEVYSKNLPIEIIGTNSKNFIGNKLQCAKVLDLSNLSEIVEYLPEELYIKVKACTPINLIEKALEKNKNFLAICLGMQLLFEESEEFGLTKGIGFFKGKVENFNKYNVEKKTFIGWNKVKFETKKILIQKIFFR